jgi:hypothetical protein
MIMTIQQFLVARTERNSHLYLGLDGALTFGVNADGFEKAWLIVDGTEGVLVGKGQVLAVVRITRSNERYFITDLITRKLYSSNPNRADAGESFALNRMKAADWELYDLVEYKLSEDWADRYVRLGRAPVNAMLETATADNFDGNFFMLKIMSSPEPEICNALADGGDLRRWARCLKPYLNRMKFTSSLLSHVENLDDSREYDILGVEQDWLAIPPVVLSADSILNNALRRLVPKEKKSCIVATARNEGVYLLEWIAYHLNAGFDHIFVYSNNNTDGSEALLRELHRCGIITYIESDVGEGGNAQVKAYNHALRVNSDVLSYEWCLFIDVDEFVCINHFRFLNVNDYLTWTEQAQPHVIAVNWILAGNEIQAGNWFDDPLIERVSKTSPFQSYLIKSFTRPELMRSSSPHYPSSNYGFSLNASSADRSRYLYKTLENNTDITNADVPMHDECFIYHYELKSLPEFLWKYSRNRGNHARTRDIQFNDAFAARIGHFRKCQPTAESSPITLPIKSESVRREIEKIRSWGSVRQIEAEMKEASKKRYKAVIDYVSRYVESDDASQLGAGNVAWLRENLSKFK